MSTFIELLEQLIVWLYSFTNDYGVAIVLITVWVRILFLPLNIRRKKQMAAQQEMAAKAEIIKKQYAKDKEKQEKELARLYQENGLGLGGCVTTFAQLPIMIGLFRAIRTVTAVECGTILLPWVESLLARDPFFLLPIATLIIQMLPQLFPYLRSFRVLKLQKPSGRMVITMFAVNCFFIFVIPTGVGLYYFVSGLCHAIEQFIYNMVCVNRLQQRFE